MFDRVLYIVGNGFDLWHGLPTKFSDFYYFARDLLDELDEYFDSKNTEATPWCDFENHLGRYNWKSFYDAHNNLEPWEDSFRPSFVYSLEDDIQEETEMLIDSLKEKLREWVGSISIEHLPKKFRFSTDSLFITFNYTSTLQEVYGISKTDILHIHGCEFEFDDLVFGHGEILQEDGEPEIDENGDSLRTMFTDSENSAKYPLYALRKPVSDILEKNIGFFDNLESSNIVVILGHSLNDIDLPYLSEVEKRLSGSIWIVSTHGDEGLHHLSQLTKAGVDRQRVILCPMDKIPSVVDSLIGPTNSSS
jgi:hypothetical protein